MYAKVIIDIAHTDIDRLYTYSVPEDLDVKPGHHVLVPFGIGNKTKEAFVIETTDSCDTGINCKNIIRTIEPYTIIIPELIELAIWIQKNYHCLLVEALRLMIPSQLRGGKVHEQIERSVYLSNEFSDDDIHRSLLKKDGTPRSEKQYEIYTLLKASGSEISVRDLYRSVPGSAGALRSLLQRGFIKESGHVTFRRPETYARQSSDSVITLNKSQQNTVHSICDSVENNTPDVFLLHGVTGSGKTEVYMNCISSVLSSGKTAIVLVPEISLTPQTVGLFHARFGDRIAVLHSRLSSGERFDEWRRLRLGLAKVAIGARSAVFAPLEKPGIIIIDEEHESSYQSESSPRYHAADIAIKRGAVSCSPVVLGSATPSLLSYFRAESGRYRLLSLPKRVMERPMPDIEVVDMRNEFLSGNNGIFSNRLKELLGECFQQKNQAMLFLNRRGYSTFVSCRACGHVILCPNCDIAMTYHKNSNVLKCHYCGTSIKMPSVCPSCKKPYIKYFGIGTEQIEEQLNALFPDIKAIRMDTDTMKQKNSFDRALSSFSRKEAQVLIGTQMIAKGHDFPNVTLVGIVAADATLDIPDYRSTERAFQLFTQVSGRAGRSDFPGRVVIQTYHPEHPAIQFSVHNDYEGFYRYEISERKNALFPPYTMFIRVLFSGTNENDLNTYGKNHADDLLKVMESELNPAAPDLLLYLSSPAPIKRKMGTFRYQILIKLLRTKRTSAFLQTVYRYESEHRSDFLSTIEINPQDMY